MLDLQSKDGKQTAAILALILFLSGGGGSSLSSLLFEHECQCGPAVAALAERVNRLEATIRNLEAQVKGQCPPARAPTSAVPPPVEDAGGMPASDTEQSKSGESTDGEGL